MSENTVETDPAGRSPHEPGAKLDAGKQRPFLVLGAFAHALAQVVRVGTYGATKYIDNGWKSVPRGRERYADAMLRHLLAEMQEPASVDRDTGISHLAHAAWNILAILELREKTEEPQAAGLELIPGIMDMVASLVIRRNQGEA